MKSLNVLESADFDVLTLKPMNTIGDFNVRNIDSKLSLANFSFSSKSADDHLFLPLLIFLPLIGLNLEMVSLQTKLPQFSRLPFPL